MPHNMRRPIEQQLYRALIDSEFRFIERGCWKAQEVCNAVQIHFPELCDDHYYCWEHCWSGYRQPEWAHVVRNAMQKSNSVQYNRDLKCYTFR